jgi:hypothetical protein
VAVVFHSDTLLTESLCTELSPCEVSEVCELPPRLEACYDSKELANVDVSRRVSVLPTKHGSPDIESDSGNTGIHSIDGLVADMGRISLLMWRNVRLTTHTCEDLNTTHSEKEIVPKSSNVGQSRAKVKHSAIRALKNVNRKVKKAN